VTAEPPTPMTFSTDFRTNFSYFETDQCVPDCPPVFDRSAAPPNTQSSSFSGSAFQKIWRPARFAKQQVAVDCLSIMGEAGTTKRNAYPYAAYRALAQRD
jgi:hypothetical protein